MNEWINFAALGKVVVAGLLFGAGLPAIFALGLRALHLGAPAPATVGAGQPGGAAADDSDRLVGGNPLGMVLAGICFLIVVAALIWGVYLIVKH